MVAESPNAVLEKHSRAEADESSSRKATAKCFHCGAVCREEILHLEEKVFCCAGCRTVFELLSENGLADFYNLAQGAGVRVKAGPGEQFGFLDEAGVRERIVDFSNDRITRVTFRLPAIHCIACVWLLENLFRLKGAIGESQVNFPRKELSLVFGNSKVKLSEVAVLLRSLGYEPELKLADLESGPKTRISRRLWLQLGIAGFAFGNVMLLSIAGYLGLDSFTGPGLRRLSSYISLILALPVFFYSALDYWRAAWISLKQKLLTIEVPIAAGIVALFGQSVFEVITGRGEGYFDSLSGLLFFLLCGRLFQQKTYSRLAFDRDFKSFFPLSVTCRRGEEEEQVSLSKIKISDRLRIRNGELIPADSRLISGPALIDYSFVTGESEPVEKQPGDYIYAGGRQIGGTIELEALKAVSQSYLTSLWNQEAFRKPTGETLDTMTNRYSQRFTKIILGIAIGSALCWSFFNPVIAVKAFSSVLIVACPCALALAAPFTLGTALRVLGRRNVFLKNTQAVESLAKVDAIVFDKTGTLTAAGAGSITFSGAELTENETSAIRALTLHSTHPYACRIAQSLGEGRGVSKVRSFKETAGCGIEGLVGEQEIWIGSAAWLASRNITIADGSAPIGSVVHVAIDGAYRGRFNLASALRPETEKLVRDLAARNEVALLSGDNEREREVFSSIFGSGGNVHFNQSPLAKLGFIKKLQERGRTVLMAGDGLNDAGALKQSNVGVAVVENVSSFSPASDVIMAATMVPRIGSILDFSKSAVGIVRLSFLISTLYNIVGLSIAASGRLAPIVCAVLMPLSSVSVVAFACSVTTLMGRKILGPAAKPKQGEAI